MEIFYQRQNSVQISTSTDSNLCRYKVDINFITYIEEKHYAVCFLYPIKICESVVNLFYYLQYLQMKS